MINAVELFKGFLLNPVEAVLMALIGLVIVFIVMELLVLFFTLYNYIIKKITGTVKKAELIENENLFCGTDEGEEIAAITAAITAFYVAENNNDEALVPPFRIRKINLK